MPSIMEKLPPVPSAATEHALRTTWYCEVEHPLPSRTYSAFVPWFWMKKPPRPPAEPPFAASAVAEVKTAEVGLKTESVKPMIPACLPCWFS